MRFVLVVALVFLLAPRSATEIKIRHINIHVQEPAPVTPYGMPYELYQAMTRYAPQQDFDQWATILGCETLDYDNAQVGGYGEISVAQILPSTLTGVGLSPTDVTTYDGAMRAAVMVADRAYEERGSKFWPWSTRNGCR